MFIITIFILIFLYYILIANNNDEFFIEKVKKYINDDGKLKKIFTHHKIRYPLEDMLKNIIIILKTGIAYRDIQKFTTIHWNIFFTK